MRNYRSGLDVASQEGDKSKVDKLTEERDRLVDDLKLKITELVELPRISNGRLIREKDTKKESDLKSIIDDYTRELSIYEKKSLPCKDRRILHTLNLYQRESGRKNFIGFLSHLAASKDWLGEKIEQQKEEVKQDVYLANIIQAGNKSQSEPSSIACNRRGANYSLGLDGMVLPEDDLRELEKRWKHLICAKQTK